MRGKVARELRKAIGVKNKREERNYHTFLVDGKSNVRQLDTTTGEVNLVLRTVEKETVECVSGDRKIYKYMKRKYHNEELEADFRPMPTKEDIDELTETIKDDMIKSEATAKTKTKEEE